MWCSVKRDDFNPLFSLFASISIRPCGAKCSVLFSFSSRFNNNFHKKHVSHFIVLQGVYWLFSVWKCAWKLRHFQAIFVMQSDCYIFKSNVWETGGSHYVFYSNRWHQDHVDLNFHWIKSRLLQNLTSILFVYWYLAIRISIEIKIATGIYWSIDQYINKNSLFLK